MRFNLFVKFFTVILLTAMGLFMFQNCSMQKSQSGLGVSSNLLSEPKYNAQLSVSTVQSSRLQYFGFFADGMEHEGTGNYIAETSEVANIHFVNADTFAGLAPKIRLAEARNSKVILISEGFLFDWQTVRLQKNYKESIASLKKYLSDNGLLDTVIGFYMIDEPYFKNSVSAVKLSDQEVFNNLKSAAVEVKNVFGSKFIVSTEAFPTLDKYLQTGQWLAFPEEYNWIAVNCYLTYGSICDTEQKYQKYVDALKSTFRGNQQLILTLDNYANRDGSIPDQNKLIVRTQFQYKLAQQYNSPALVSFLYQGAEDRYGVADMPILRNYIFNLATSITGKGQSNVSLPKSVAAPVAVPVKGPAAIPVVTASPAFVVGAGDDGLNHAASIPLAASVSNSASTSFVANGNICTSDNLFLKITGSFSSGTGSSAEQLKGCVAPTGSGQCNLVDGTAFRKFSASEIVNSSTIQIQTAAANFPVGSYEVFVLGVFVLPTGGIQKVGTFNIQKCDTPAAITIAAPVVTEPSSCKNLDPQCEGANSVRRNTCGQVVEVWKLAPMCTAVKCEGRDYVRRDSNQAVIEVWKNAPNCN